MIELAGARTLLRHELAPGALAAGRGPRGGYVALCGADVLPAAMEEPGGAAAGRALPRSPPIERGPPDPGRHAGRRPSRVPRDGAQKTREAVPAGLPDVGGTGTWRSRTMHNLLAGGFVSGHSAVTGKQVAYALLAALSATWSRAAVSLQPRWSRVERSGGQRDDLIERVGDAPQRRAAR